MSNILADKKEDEHTGSAQGPSEEQPPTLKEKDWTILLQAISMGKCTPFLGAGACHGLIPLGAEIAREWARLYSYPMDDDYDLARVSQFIATEYNPAFPKDSIMQRFRNHTLPKSIDPCEPHKVLANLPLPVYITTNYDDFHGRSA